MGQRDAGLPVVDAGASRILTTTEVWIWGGPRAVVPGWTNRGLGATAGLSLIRATVTRLHHPIDHARTTLFARPSSVDHEELTLLVGLPRAEYRRFH